MSETVYILGAGANQGVVDRIGRRPPLSNNFFSLAQFGTRVYPAHLPEEAQDIFNYIRKYWRKDAGDLAAEAFDVEELFTLLQLQKAEAFRRDDLDAYRSVAQVYNAVTAWFTEYLAGFRVSDIHESAMEEFGRTLWQERSVVITFNYDCIVETAIAYASGVSHGPYPDHGDVSSDVALTYSHFNWNTALCYGVPFDEVEPFRAGVPEPIAGNVFYAHPRNQLYDSPILKLHGSINWYRYVPVRVRPEVEQIQGPAPRGSILQIRPTPSFVGNVRQGWMTERELITPALYKQAWLETDRFDTLWRRAAEELSRCRRLVIVGYSFPPTDFATKRLFLETFADRPPLDELVVVDPDQERIERMARALTHHAGPIRSVHGIGDYLAAPR